MKEIATISLFFFLKITTASGQQPADSLFFKNEKIASPVEIETVVTMKNGGQVRGELVEWRQGETVAIVLRNGLRVEIPEAEIVRLKQFRYGDRGALKDKKAYNFRERGWFGTLNFGILPYHDNGNWGEYNRQFMQSFTFAATLGFQESRQGAIAMGIAIDKYGDAQDMTIVPLFFDYRCYFLRSANTPYFNLMLGHGFPAKVNDPQGGSETVVGLNGGIFVSPNIGVRLGARPTGNATIDFGWRFQKCGFEADNFGSNNSTSLNYKRFTLRFGMVF